ncbi:TIGR04255 family protein [Simplicispira psychrophila]|uniref:TIGR04255 family protein n=1 Tax=Simplicispira psychrophila TaxID=80882 RepID=UPI00048151C3|nr:TIGR04255 family protein [Simplicispira psychrophila]
MGMPLKNPPVYFTVAQVRFNTLLKLADYLPSIQEGLRKAGFPAFSTHKGIAVQLVVQDGLTIPQPISYEQFLFGNVEQTHSFVLSTDTLTFQSTNYGTYETFSSTFLEGLKLVHDVVTLDFTERVGLRYLDHLSPKASDSLDRYLASQVRGLSACIGGESVHSYAEAFNLMNEVRLRTRVVIQDDYLAFPPDLLPQGMVLQQRFVQAKGLHAILDMDGSIEGRQLFSLSTLNQQLQSIHHVISTAFHTTVTDHARAAWDEREGES